ncbi:MAG: MFS transporter [Candidatus Parcubacteria bacterium]|nr:MAG: MFS transporter [Candidatus Parcubacteria bacterium]
MLQRFKYLIIFALVYFFSPNGLSSLPNLTLNFLLKETLKLTATQLAYFSAITILGWAIKPLWGLISDLLPIFGSKRKSYLVLTSLLAAFCWFGLSLTQNYSVWLLLMILTISSFAYAFQDVVTDALMIEIGKKEKKLTEFQSIQWLAVSIAQIITGFAGGLAAENLRAQTTFGIAIFFPLIIALIVLILLRKTEEEPVLRFKEFKENFKSAVLTKEFLLVNLFLFLWRFSPSIGAPMFYYQVDVLKFSKIFLGTLSSLSAIGSALGAISFNYLTKYIKFKKLLFWSVLLGGVFTFWSLIYLTDFIKNNLYLAKILAIIDSLIFSTLGMIFFLTMLTFAAQKTDPKLAGSVFAFVTSVMNVGLMASEALGGWLFAKIGLAPLIIVSGITSLAILIFIPFLKVED